MRFKKSILSLLVGASLCVTGGVALNVTGTNTADAAPTAKASVTFTNVNITKVHDVSSANSLYLTFITKDSGADVSLKSWLPGSTTEDTNTRLNHFAKQIKFQTSAGDVYNFASAGKITTQGATAGDAADVNICFQKVDSTGAVVAFDAGDKLIFPQGMVYESDTNSDAAVDTVWKFASTLTVQYSSPNTACASTFGCIGQGTSGDVCCNAAGGFHVYQETTANSYDAIAIGSFGDAGVTNAATLGMKFSSTTTVATGVQTIDLGYRTWVDPDNCTTAFLPNILINGTPANTISGVSMQGFDQKDGLRIYGFSALASGGTIVIPQGVTFTSPTGAKMTTMCKFTWTYNGSGYDATATYMSNQIAERVGLEADLPTSGGNQGGGDSGDQGGGDQGGGSTEAKPNRLLASFQSTDTQVFRDDAYYNQTVNKDTAAQGYYYNDVHSVTGAVTKRAGTSWDVDYKSTVTFDKTPYDNKGEAYPWYINNSYSVTGEFVTTGMPAGSDGNGAYKFAWGQKTPGLWYPSIMFGFPNTVEYAMDDELEFTLHLSEDMDQRYTLWATSALEKNVWDAQKKFTGSLIQRGKWTTISMPIKDFLRPDGTLAPIALTFVYADIANSLNTAGKNDDGNNNNDGLDPATIYFDKVEVKTVIKTLETDYRTQDLSEVVPITGEMSFTGTVTTNMDTFDFTKDMNIGFIREDISTNVVKLKMSITKNSVFDMYYVMNGTAKYYDKGGIFYWISNEGVNIGYNGKAFTKTALPAAVTNGETFELELRAIPYYVEGITAGYYAEMLINGTKACESGYISSADCSFGQYFGFYMHTTKTDVTAKIAPVVKADTSPLTITLRTQPSKKHLEIGDEVQIKATQKCKIYGQSAVTYEVIDGTNCAEIVEGKYLAGTGDGIATVVGKITNVFGTFTGEPFLIAVGAAELPQDSTEDSSTGDTQDSTTSTPPASTDSSEEPDYVRPGTSSEEPDYVRPNNGNSGNQGGSKVGGCGSTVGLSAMVAIAVAMTAGFVMKKNKDE